MILSIIMSSNNSSNVVRTQEAIDALTSTRGPDMHDDADPSTENGFRVVYDRETPLELRVQDESDSQQQVGTLEAVRVKILREGDEDAPNAIRVELTSDEDLFFHYAHVCDPQEFANLQETQRLMVDFPDYVNVLIRMLNNCINEPQNHLAVLVMQPEDRARLDFIQNMEYKFVELLSADFLRSSEDVVQKSITFRYNALKSRLLLMQNRLQDVSNLVKAKNPSLLLQMQKTLPSYNSNQTAPYNRGLNHAMSTTSLK